MARSSSGCYGGAELEVFTRGGGGERQVLEGDHGSLWGDLIEGGFKNELLLFLIFMDVLLMPDNNMNRMKQFARQ